MWQYSQEPAQNPEESGPRCQLRLRGRRFIARTPTRLESWSRIQWSNLVYLSLWGHSKEYWNKLSLYQIFATLLGFRNPEYIWHECFLHISKTIGNYIVESRFNATKICMISIGSTFSIIWNNKTWQYCTSPINNSTSCLV